jgi:hypothetical protein
VVGALIIFSRVSSGGISTAVSSCKFFSATLEVRDGRTKVAVSFDFSSSLRENVWVGVKARNDMRPEKNNL